MTAHPMAQPLDRERVQLSRAQSQGKLTRQSAWPCWVPSGLGSCITYPGRSHTPRAQVQASGVCETAIVCTCMCAHHVYVYMCVCVCVCVCVRTHAHTCTCVSVCVLRVFPSFPSLGPLEGLGQRISTSVRNLGPLPRVSHPLPGRC
jgi:hypothetical protein